MMGKTSRILFKIFAGSCMMGKISGILWAGSASEDGEEPTPHHSMGEGGRGRWQVSRQLETNSQKKPTARILLWETGVCVGFSD